MLNVILNKNEEENVKLGFPWVYNNEIYSFDGEIFNGEVVKVLNYNKEFATELYNKFEKIICII